MYSVADLAAFFRLSPGTIRLWIKHGALRAAKINGRWRITERHLQEMYRRTTGDAQEALILSRRRHDPDR